MANDHAKGDVDVYLSISCHAALILMNDFKPLDQGYCSGGSPGYSICSEAEAEGSRKQPEPSATITKNTLPIRSATIVVGGHPARCCPNKTGKTKKDAEDNKSVSSAKTIKSLTK
jgi:hypothetical protein